MKKLFFMMAAALMLTGVAFAGCVGGKCSAPDDDYYHPVQTSGVAADTVYTTGDAVSDTTDAAADVTGSAVDMVASPFGL